MHSDRRSVTRPDYISLNVPGLLQRYANPTEQWRQKIIALTGTQLEMLKKYALIQSGASALRVPLDQVVIRFSDYTELGQEFVLTGAIDKWMAACDRKNTLAAYEDTAALEKRIVSFLKARKPEDK
jgi:hypothetical protein